MLANYIDGQWTQGGRDEVEDLNPARRGEVIDVFRPAGRELVDHAVDTAVRAFDDWSRRPAFERAAVLARAADLLFESAPTYGADLSREEGKTLPEGIGEVVRAAEVLRYHAAEAAQPMGEVYRSARPDETILSLHVPVGPVVAITPWNFPAFIPAFKIGPALLHGNTVVWKPSELVPLLSVRLVEVFAEAGLPPGVLNLVLGDAEEATRLIERDGVRACTFTGSTPVGRHLIGECARRGIKVQAEMGGKNSVIVFDDANTGRAVDAIVSGAMRSTGQKCTATSRVIVSEQRFEEVVEGVTRRAAALVVGDPLTDGVDVGPVASEAQHRRVLGYLDLARAEGAMFHCGGGEGPATGWFIEPTVLTGMPPTGTVCTDEIFGPVVTIVPAANDDEAFELANHGPFGLSGSVFTSRFDRISRATRDFEVGVLHVNSETTGADVHVPFGGVKHSGSAGREQGKSALDFYTEVRTAYIAPA